jgi:serine/threonine protein kinase
MFFKKLFVPKQQEKKETTNSTNLENINRLEVSHLLNNRYQIENALSDSSYLAIDIKRERRQVIVKHIQLNTKKVDLDEVSNFFGIETTRLMKLTGSCNLIPKLLDSIEDNNNFYLVSDYIQGKTIAKELADSQPSELVVAKLLKEILTELQVLHNLNIIHKTIEANKIIRRACDLKLMFVYYGDIDEKCRTTLIDKFFDNIPEGVHVNVSFRSPQSPELLAKRPQFASDIYAVGLIGLQLLVDMPLHDIPKSPATGEYLWGKYSNVSDRLASILNKMIECSLRRRYKIIAEVLEDIDLFIEQGIDEN